MLVDTLILCVGNPMRRDDGFGAAVAARLRAAGPVAGVTIAEHWGEGSELMAAWAGYGRVVLVDVAAGSGAAPGTVHRFDAGAEELPRGFFRYSTHHFGLAEAVETARALGTLPAQVVVYAVEAADFDFGEGLSPPVADAVDPVVRLVYEEMA